MADQLTSSITQLSAILIISLLVFGTRKLFLKDKETYSAFIGLKLHIGQFDKKYFLLLNLVIVFGILSTVVQYYFLPDMRELILSDSSPYARILTDGLTVRSIISASFYCFISASASEEVLFRGVIAQRLYKSFGETNGNIIQSLIFWFMHLLIFKFTTGNWFSVAQIIAFITSFCLGMILGYSNFRNGGGSILPSFILHGFCNFFVFLTLGTCLKL